MPACPDCVRQGSSPRFDAEAADAFPVFRCRLCDICRKNFSFILIDAATGIQIGEYSKYARANTQRAARKRTMAMKTPRDR